MEKIKVADLEVEMVLENQVITPEQVLWMAVIDRAMLDLLRPTSRLSIKDIRNLDWFFFESKPEKFNLSYICTNFLDYPDADKRIRNHIGEIRANGQSDDFYERRCRRIR